MPSLRRCRCKIEAHPHWDVHLHPPIRWAVKEADVLNSPRGSVDMHQPRLQQAAGLNTCSLLHTVQNPPRISKQPLIVRSEGYSLPITPEPDSMSKQWHLH